MKTFLVITALCISSFSIAQKNNSYEQSIDDNGKKLSIKIKGDVDGKQISYNRSFDVTGWSEEKKDVLKKRIYDSLGMKAPVTPVVPIAPLPPQAPAVIVAPAPPEAPSIAEAPESVTLTAPAPLAEVIPPVPSAPTVYVSNQFDETLAVGGDNPYTKEIKYSPKTGILYMRYRFNKKGEEVSYERSVDAKDKSKEERSQIIKNYEKEIGLLKTARL